jgi:hypothetical protein
VQLHASFTHYSHTSLAGILAKENNSDEKKEEEKRMLEEDAHASSPSCHPNGFG